MVMIEMAIQWIKPVFMSILTWDGFFYGNIADLAKYLSKNDTFSFLTVFEKLSDIFHMGNKTPEHIVCDREKERSHG